MTYKRETWRGYVHVYCYFEPLKPVEDLTAWMDTVVSDWMEDFGYTFYSKDTVVYVDNFEIVQKGGKTSVRLLIVGDIEGESEDDFEGEGASIAEDILRDFSGFKYMARIFESGWETDCVDIDTWYDEDAAYEASRDK